MRKNMFNRRIEANSQSARGKRYSAVSTTVRRNDGDDSGHSMWELTNMSRHRHQNGQKGPGHMRNHADSADGDGHDTPEQVGHLGLAHKHRGKRDTVVPPASGRAKHSHSAFEDTSGQQADGSRSPVVTKSRRPKKARWYAVADPHMPTWGVYADWQEVAAFLKPGHYKGFQSEHAAREWLEQESICSTAPGRHGKRSSKPKSRRSKKRWYAVVRGRVPGVYDRWDDAWAKTDGYTEARPYRTYSRQEAVETFMRWSRGSQVHPVSSTMAQRGESVAEFADTFLGLEGASIIRSRAFAKHAKERQKKFEASGDPIWDTGTSVARDKRPVEGTTSALTLHGPQSKRQNSRHAVPFSSGANRKKVGREPTSTGRSKMAQTGTRSSASAEGTTTNPSPQVQVHKGGQRPSEGSFRHAALISPLGAGQHDEDSTVLLSGITTGDAHQVQSPEGYSEPVLHLTSSNSGAADGAAAKYVGTGNSSHGDEPRPRNTTASHEARDPLDRSNQRTSSPMNSGNHKKGGRNGSDRDGASTASAAGTPAGSSTESDRANARVLFHSSESPQSSSTQTEIASAKKALRTLDVRVVGILYYKHIRSREAKATCAV